MPIKQYRRTFHTSAQINQLAKDGGAVKTFTLAVQMSEVEKARFNLNKMSHLQTSCFKRFKAGSATLAELKSANHRKLCAVNELERLAPQAPLASISSRKSLYQ